MSVGFFYDDTPLRNKRKGRVKMEQLVVELQDVEVSYLDKTIVKIHHLKVHQYDRIGIVGKNGSGKSTLLQLIYGSVVGETGYVRRQIEFSYFQQKEAPAEIEAERKLEGQWQVPNQDIAHMSGGEQTRLKIAQLFTYDHGGVLIDEPTTHLDKEGIDFLIEELKYYYGTLLLVSHDRYVLDQIVTKIWEIDDGEIREHSGNYSDYEMQKDLERKQQQEQHEKVKKEKERLMEAAQQKRKQASKITQANKGMSKKDTNATANRMFMTKSKGTSEKAMQRTAKALEQRAEHLEEVDRVEKAKPLRFQQPVYLQMHNKFPIMGDGVTLTRDNQSLLQEARFQFPLGQTIAVTGANGSGKSSLLQHIKDQGQGIMLSPNVVFGVYQQHGYQFNKSMTVIEFMKRMSDKSEGQIRAVLHAMDFVGNDIKKNVQNLSGGESIRLKLCQLFLGAYNVLLLDEPNNFLDVASLNALEIFIKAYEGTILLVSHDRTFIKEVADVVYQIEEQQLRLKGDE